MGLIWESFKALGEGESSEEKDKRIENNIFNDEDNALGMDEWEKEDCRKSGIDPEEWAEENDPDYKE